jgi:hypothetical protein
VRRSVAVETARDLAKLGQPVDRAEWKMTPQTVNAYYNPLQNEIVFPAAILQPPFFDPAADPAMNYGGIGAVIGHEMLHGYDDQGSRYDARGNLNNWWEEADRKRFEARTAKLVEQFDDYVAVDGLHVNGKLTLGENVAAEADLLIGVVMEPRPTGRAAVTIDASAVVHPGAVLVVLGVLLRGVDAARGEAARQHGPCFAKGYRTGWIKWQDSSFDETKHADCVMRGVMADVARRNLVASRAARAAEEAKRPKVVAAVTTPRPPPPPRTPPPVLGRVAVGNVQVLQLTRSPNISGRLSFVAIGSADALASVVTCSYVVMCDGNEVGLPAGQKAIAPCLLKVQGAAAPGELSFLVLAPAQGACSLELTLTDGARPRSATVAVPLS